MYLSTTSARSKLLSACGPHFNIIVMMIARSRADVGGMFPPGLVERLSGIALPAVPEQTPQHAERVGTPRIEAVTRLVLEEAGGRRHAGAGDPDAHFHQGHEEDGVDPESVVVEASVQFVFEVYA